jgi:hypothetical protein
MRDCAVRPLASAGALVMTVLAGVFASEVATADDAALARCRAISDNAARLACYDALPLTGGEAKADTKPGPAAAPAKTPTEQFGMEEKIVAQTIAKSAVDQIESRVAGKFEGWWPNAKIPLVNGQVWQVSDGSSRYYDLDSPEVTITRGVLGAFYLNVKGDNRTVGVRRIQ